MDGYDSKEIYPYWLTANCSVVVLVEKEMWLYAIATVSETVF